MRSTRSHTHDRQTKPLTAMERRVAALVAERRTNRGVAEALGLSGKEVERHLARMYRKLGICTRPELEAALAEAGYTRASIEAVMRDS